MMGRIGRVVLALTFVVAVAAGCAGVQASSGARSTIVPITEFKTVAGVWSGVALREPPSGAGDDWVKLHIHEDGTYEAVSARPIGVLWSRGTLTLGSGRMRSSGARGAAIYTLYDRGGTSALVVNATMVNGATYSAELRRAK